MRWSKGSQPDYGSWARLTQASLLAECGDRPYASGREDTYLIEAWWLYRGWPGTDSNGALRGTDLDVRWAHQSQVAEGS